MAQPRMAHTALLAALSLCLVCLLSSADATGRSFLKSKLKGTQIFTFYLHEDANSSYFVVPPLAGFSANFGALVVIDQKITLVPDVNSLEVGRGKGLAVFSHKGTSGAPELVWTAVFNDTRPLGFAKSTLSFRGFNELAAAERELSIVSGTGLFRLAQGWATFSTYFRDPVTRVGIQKIQANVRIPLFAWTDE